MYLPRNCPFHPPHSGKSVVLRELAGYPWPDISNELPWLCVTVRGPQRLRLNTTAGSFPEKATDFPRSMAPMKEDMVPFLFPLLTFYCPRTTPPASCLWAIESL